MWGCHVEGRHHVRSKGQTLTNPVFNKINFTKSISERESKGGGRSVSGGGEGGGGENAQHLDGGGGWG